MIQRAKTLIGGSGNSRGTNDARRPQCFVVLFSSMMTSLMSGSSPPLHLHGIPAPHRQPSSASQARSGWFSQTHPMPKQMGHILSMAGRSLGGFSPGWGALEKNNPLRKSVAGPPFRHGVPQTNSPSCQSRNASKARLGVQASIMPKNTACKVVISFRSLDVTFAQDKRFGRPSVACQTTAPNNAAVLLLHICGAQ